MTDRPPTPAIDSAGFRSLMSRWATGVSVVTAQDGEVDAGLTVNAFLSVSLTPPTVLVSLTRDADTLPVIERSHRFAVNFLAADQRALSERFALAVPPSEKFAGVPVHRTARGVPLLDATLGSVECRVASTHSVHDHVLVVGEVVYQELGREAPPLLFFRSAYSEAEGSDRLHLGTRAQR